MLGDPNFESPANIDASVIHDSIIVRARIEIVCCPGATQKGSSRLPESNQKVGAHLSGIALSESGRITRLLTDAGGRCSAVVKAAGGPSLVNAGGLNFCLTTVSCTLVECFDLPAAALHADGVFVLVSLWSDSGLVPIAMQRFCQHGLITIPRAAHQRSVLLLATGHCKSKPRA
jgi:hypothetical protein